MKGWSGASAQGIEPEGAEAHGGRLADVGEFEHTQEGYERFDAFENHGPGPPLEGNPSLLPLAEAR